MKKLSRFAKLALTLATVATLSGVTVIGLVGCNNETTPPDGIVQTQPVKVTVDKSTGGNVTLDSDSYISGDNVQLTITPDTGYELDSVKIGNVDKTRSVRGGLLTIENVLEDVTVTVAFKARTASVVSYNIINNKGGTASLSASNGYVGDRVLLTVMPDNGYEVMTVKVNGGENLANSLVGNSIDIELTSATIEIEIEFYAFPVKAMLAFNEEGGTATITDLKDVYNVGDTIEVTVTPKAAWHLQSITVNGEEKKDETVDGKLTLTVEKVGNINIAAKFDAIPAHAEFKINATKYGNEYDLEGAIVELKHENGRKYKDITVTDGKITADVIPGKYKVSIQDFTTCEITVESSGYTTAVSTMYQPFKDSAAWNVSNAANGTVTINSDYGHLYLKEDFGDFIATYKIKKMGAGNRMSLGVKYGDKIMGFSSDISVDNPGVWLPNSKDWDNRPWGNANYISNAPNDWFGFTDAEQTAYKGNGIEITIARSGSRLYMFFGERFVSSWELFNSTESVALAFTGWFPVGHNLPIDISTVEEDVTALVESTVTKTEQNGTVTLDKTDGKYSLGETVTVTLEAKEAQVNEKYVLESLTLDGNPVDLNKVVDGVYTFIATQKAHNVSATFKAVSMVDINVAITAEKFGEAQTVQSVTLSNANYNKSHTLENGNLKVEGLAEGTYLISAEGYIPVEITVAVSGSTQTVKLIYNPFNPSDKWDVSKYGNGKLTNTEHGHLVMKDEFDSFAFSIKLKKTSVRTSVNVKFGDKMIGFSNDGNSAGLWLPGDSWGNIPWDNVTYQSVNPDWYGNESFNGAYETDGVTYKFVKSGNILYLFVEDTYVASWTVEGNATIGLTGWGSVELTVSFSTDTNEIAGYVSSTVTTSVSNGTVTLDNADKKYNLGETVTVTLEAKEAQANEKYVLESLTLDGNPVDLSKVVDGMFTFTATQKVHTLSASFKAVAIANINVAITAEKFGETQTLQSVTLSNANYNKTHTLDNGNLVVEGLAEGTYSVSAEGYIPVEITVAVSGSTQTAKLIYNPFIPSENWNVTAMDGGIKINSGVEHSHLYLAEDMSGDFAFTINIKNIATTGERRTAFTVKYGNNKMLTFTNVWNNDYGMSIPAGDWNIIWNGASHTYNEWITLDFTAEEKTAYNSADGVNVKFVRQGTTLYVFFNNRFVNSYTLFGADEKVECALTGWSLFDDSNNRFEIPVTAEIDAETIEGYVSSAVTATATNGTATLDGEVTSKTYKVGETVTVTITSDTHQDTNKRYVLDTLKVDGKGIAPDDINSGVYTFTATKGTHTVVATFKEVSVVNLNVAVTAEKFGALQDITKVILSGANYAETEIDLLDESGVKKLIISGLADDTYKISIEGYIPVTVTSATQSVKLIYQPFADTDKWNISEYGNGKLTNTEHGHLVMKDEFDSFAFSIKLKKTSVRTSVNVKFGDKMIGFSNDGNSAGLWLPGDSWGNIPWDNVTYQSVNPDWYGNESFNGAYETDGVTYKFVKSGNILYLFVEDTYVASWTVEGNATIGLTGWGSVELAVSFSTDASEIAGYVSSAVTASATHGTATLDGNETSKTYKVGETVNVTLTPETAADASKKYVLESLTVDGNSVDLNNVVDGAYSFTATKKNHAVVATFKEVDLTISLNITVTAEKYGVSQTITSVTLSNNAGYNQTHTLTGDSLQVSGLENVAYTISVDGYIPVTVTSETQSVKLVYQPFAATEDWDTSGYGNGTVTMNSVYGHLLLNGEFGDFAVTYKIKRLDGGKRVSFGVKYGDGKIYGFSSDLAAENAGVWLPNSNDWNNKPWDDANYNSGDLGWHGFDNELSDYQGDGVEITIVRSGTTLYLFIKDRFVTSWELFTEGEYVELAFTGWLPSGYELPVSVSTDSEKVQEWVNKKPANAS